MTVHYWNVGMNGIRTIMGIKNIMSNSKLPINQIICGDCLEVMKEMPDKSIDLILTDPVWPNSLSILDGADEPFKLFKAAAQHFPRLTDRVVVHLGCTSDPRFLLAIPKEMPFIRVCWLRYSFPSFRGRILIGSDIAYAFGRPPKSRKGYHLIPGEVTSNNSTEIKTKLKIHPTVRNLDHVKYLIDKFSAPGDLILDPFIGSGTTARAAKDLKRNFIGIEINPDYCKIAEERLAQGVL